MRPITTQQRTLLRAPIVDVDPVHKWDEHARRLYHATRVRSRQLSNHGPVLWMCIGQLQGSGTYTMVNNFWSDRPS
jgi:hypothetical protein